LGQVLGYDFQEDVHRDLFAAFPQKRPGVALRDLSETKNRLILWPRGHFKTSAVVVEIVQTILNYPDVRILLMQGSLKLTKGWLSEIKSHFTGKNTKSKLKELFPEFCAEKLGTAEHFTVPARVRTHLKEATVTAASPKAVSTGQHYEAFYADDLVHAKNYLNVELLDKLETEFFHFVPLIDPGYYITVTGTRYSHADIYARIQKRNKGEWLVSIRPCYKEDGTLLFTLREAKDGRHIGFTPEMLAKFQEDDPETFSAQYLNQIVSAKNHIFPSELLMSCVRASSDKDFPIHSPAFFMIDLAEGGKESDHSVVTVGKSDGTGRVWIVDCVGSNFSPSALTTVVLQMVLKHRPVKVLIEKAAGATFFMEHLVMVGREKNIMVPAELLKSERQKGAKYVRIASLESAFRNKRIFLSAGIVDFERLEEEFTQFPRGRHDDRPDCIAMLYRSLTAQQPYSQPLTRQPTLIELMKRTPFGEPERRSSPLGDTGFSC